MFEKMTAIMDGNLRLIPGYDCMVMKKGKVVYRHMNGFRELETGEPMRGDEVYNLYSCSKIVTCTAALLLYERGVIRLDDKLSDYIPAFGSTKVRASDGGLVPLRRPILLEDLFTMTAGLTYDLGTEAIRRGQKELGGVCRTVEMMNYIAEDPLATQPGECYRYSLCHDVLAAVVEVASGKRFGEFVRENIFAPLGMNNSTFCMNGPQISAKAGQYRWNAETGRLDNVGKEIMYYKFGSEYESGGAGMISTVEDYMKFNEAMRKDEILRTETRILMTTDHLTDSQHATYDRTPYGYGLGVRCAYRNYPEQRTDFGWGGAAGAYIAIDPVNEMSLFYAQHVLASIVRKDAILPLAYSEE